MKSPDTAPRPSLSILLLRSLWAAAALLATLGIAELVHAQSGTSTWTGTASSGWDDFSDGKFNWNPNSLPTATSAVAFAGPVAFNTVNLEADRTVHSLQFSGASAYAINQNQLTISSGDVTQTGTATHTIGSDVRLGGPAAWNINGGTLKVTGDLDDNALGFGLAKSGVGTLELAGDNSFSTLETFGGLTEIVGGSLDLHVNPGAVALVQGGGELKIRAGGEVTIPTGASVFVQSAGVADKLTVQGAGSKLHGGQQLVLGLGSAGGGHMLVEDGGSVSGQTVLGVGFTAQIAASTLNINHQGTVSATIGSFGVLPGAIGEARIEGLSSSLTLDRFVLGGLSDSQRGGTGRVEIRDQGLVTASFTEFFTSDSTLKVDHGRLVTTKLQTMYGTTPKIFVTNSAGAPAITIDSTDLVNAGSFGGVIANGTNGPGSVLKRGAGEQILTNRNAYTGGTIVEEGKLTLGVANALSAQGSVALSGGVLAIGSNVQQIFSLNLNGGTLTGGVGGVLTAIGGNLQSGAINAEFRSIESLIKTTSGTVTATRRITAGGLNVQDGVLDLQAGLVTGSLLMSGGQLKLRGSVEIQTATGGSGGTVVIGGPTTIMGPFDARNLTLDVGAQTVAFLSTTATQLGATTLAGGVIAASNASLHGPLSGYGTLSGNVSGSANATISPSRGGALTLGNASSAQGFANYLGVLNVGANQINLLSASTANLGRSTTLAGGTLASLNGIMLPWGDQLSGHGVVSSTFVNQGLVTGGAASNRLKFANAVSGSGSFAGNVEFQASYSPGISTAATNFAGNATFASTSQLRIELGGVAAGTGYDHIDVTSLLTLRGTLDVSLTGGFTPTAGESFDLFDWGTLSGAFAAINLPSLPGLAWDTSQLYTTGTLSVVSTLDADFDENGVVNNADLAAWRSGYGDATATHGDGDANGDQRVDGADFLAWQRQFGGNSADAATAPVPEPAAWLLAIGAMLTMRVLRDSARDCGV